MIVSSSGDFPTRGVLYYEFCLFRFCFVFLDGLVKVKEFRSVFFVSFVRTFYRSAKCIPKFLRSTHLRELESPRQRIYGKVSIVLSENEV